MKTQAELRAFTWGALVGIFVWFACLYAVSWYAEIRWQPTKNTRILAIEEALLEREVQTHGDK